MTRWFTSDTHFAHPFIAGLRGFVRDDQAQGRTINELRHLCRETGQPLADFIDTEAHDQTIVDHFNQVMKPEDELYILGDLSSGGISSMKKALARVHQLVVPAERRILILGNHDESRTINKLDEQMRQAFTLWTPQHFVQIDGHGVILSHYPWRNDFLDPVSAVASQVGNAANFLKSDFLDDAPVKKVGWRHLLHGHTHSSAPFEMRDHSEMNVGLDAWDLWPVSEDDVRRMLFI